MSLETANPVIVALLLLPAVICGSLLVIGALNTYFKERKERDEHE